MFGSEGDGFDPGHNAMIFAPGNALRAGPKSGGAPRLPQSIKAVAGSHPSRKIRRGNAHEAREQAQPKAEDGLDPHGRPVSSNEYRTGGGRCTSLSEQHSDQRRSSVIARWTIRTRLHAELKRSSSGKVSDRQIGRDLHLLQRGRWKKLTPWRLPFPRTGDPIL